MSPCILGASYVRIAICHRDALNLGAGPVVPHADVQEMSLLVVVQSVLAKTNCAVGQEKRASMGHVAIARAPMLAGVVEGETKWGTIRGPFCRGCARCTVSHEGWG